MNRNLTANEFAMLSSLYRSRNIATPKDHEIIARNLGSLGRAVGYVLFPQQTDAWRTEVDVDGTFGENAEDVAEVVKSLNDDLVMDRAR
jgi:hypothetical protein